MNALLIVAHGSRRAESNEEIRSLTRLVAEASTGRFELIECAYLELAEPLIPNGIASLVERGATSVLVLPYFLARGAHVASDIPKEVACAQAGHPDIEISIADYLGANKAIPSLLAEIASQSLSDA